MIRTRNDLLSNYTVISNASLIQPRRDRKGNVDKKKKILYTVRKGIQCRVLI